MTLASDAMTMNALHAATEFGWERRDLAGLVACFVDGGGFVVEVDGLAESEMGQGWGGSPRRRLALAPVDYVRAVLSAGMDFEGEYARRLAGECIVGGSDFDYAPALDALDPRFNARIENRLRVRTLDFHLKNLPQPSLLILAGEGSRPDILRSGRRMIAEHGPIIAARPMSRGELDAIVAALREIEPSYECAPPPGGGVRLGEGAYVLAAPAARREIVDALLQGSAERALGHRPRDLLRPGSALRSTLLRISPDAFVASSGFHAVEKSDGSTWRWGGALPRLAALIEAPEPGLYEIRVLFVSAVPGAVESIEGIRVNGALLADPDRGAGDLAFSVLSRIDRRLLLEIDCPCRRTTPPDPRQLSVALAEIRLRRLPR
jgi:hypothetical protein